VAQVSSVRREYALKKRLPLRDARAVTRSDGIGQRINEALALHKQGNLALAEILYRDVLRAMPSNAQALGMLGLIEAAKRNSPAAIDLLRRSLEGNPYNPATHFNLGLLYQEQQRHEDALRCFDCALALAPAAAQAMNARGLALKNLGRWNEAVASYDQALHVVPGYFEALNNKGVALGCLNRHEEAIACFLEALRLRPDSAEVHNNLGYALHKSGRYGQALASYSRALELKPDYHDALNSKGMALHQLGRFDEAIELYKSALSVDPASVEATMNMGVSLYESRRHDEAYACFRRALEIQPDNLDVRLNMGNVLFELNRVEEALASYRQVIDARPGDQDVLMNTGNALRDVHRFDEAMHYYDRALALDPSCADVHWNMALCLLVMGNLQRGWEEYEWRTKLPALYDVARYFEAPLWLGVEPLNGKTILIHAEQGLGDTIQFCRYAHSLSGLGARVVLEIQRPLAGVLEHLEEVDCLVVRGEPLPGYDFHCPLLSLPYAFRTLLDTIPARAPYLHPDPALVARWRSKVQEKPGPNIGLVWSGNASHKADHRRSMPLATLINGLADGARYWSLQKDLSREDQALIGQNEQLQCFEENDFVHTAAQISLMDAVVSVDTAVAHLAAALGKPTLILLAHTADWRWLWPRQDSPWYPGVTLIRQQSPGDWRPVLHQLAGKLAELVRARSAR
jgi:tetratricopeptide (TPR) repeat protein